MELKLKVAIIVPRLEQLGPIKVVQSLVNALYRVEKLQLKIFYLDKVIDPQIKMMVPVERLDRKYFHFDDYDIIHTNGIRPDLFAFLNRKKIKCHISTIHNFVFEDLSYTYNKLFSRIFGNVWLIIWRQADKLVCISKTMKDYYSKWLSDSKLVVIHNGITKKDDYLTLNNEIVKTLYSFRSRGLKVLGTAGILTKRKGIDQILYAIAEESDFAMVIFGKGKELKNLQQLAIKLKITDRCHFCGFRSNVVNYFNYFDFFIMPSRSEGFGLALVEAAQQKVPVICSDIDIFKELFNGEDVTFFKLDDANSLNIALINALKIGKKKVEHAYSTYINNYTDQIMALHYSKLYMSIL